MKTKVCPKCKSNSFNTKGERVDFPNKYYSIYNDSTYPQAEALGIPIMLYDQCIFCGYKIPIMSNRHYILSN